MPPVLISWILSVRGGADSGVFIRLKKRRVCNFSHLNLLIPKRLVGVLARRFFYAEII
jgi:hypothetical protein